MPSRSQPSFFFGDCELPSLTIGEPEDPLGEQSKNFEEPIGEEKHISPNQSMAENVNNEILHIKEANGEAIMKNIIPATLPHFHGLNYEDPHTLMFEFVVICRTYDYASDEKKLKLFPSTLKDAALR